MWTKVEGSRSNRKEAVEKAVPLCHIGVMVKKKYSSYSFIT
jgi:hypothetical protein